MGIVRFFPANGDLASRIFVRSFFLVLVQDFLKKVGKLLGFSTTSHTE